MVLTIILTVIFFLALGILLVIVWRKLPQLKVIDPGSSESARVQELKSDLLRQRFVRVTAPKIAVLSTTMGAPMRFMQSVVRGAANKLMALERSYSERQKSGQLVKPAQAEIRRLLDEIAALMSHEKYEAAEKMLIELISLDAKNVEAFELLGRLYMVTRDLQNAKETFIFLLKLAPKDASVKASLGEIAQTEGDLSTAFDYFSQAKKLSPNNPKYLDFFIEAALGKGDYKAAEDGLADLERVNPQNKKIPLFAERIADGKPKIKNRA